MNHNTSNDAITEQKELCQANQNIKNWSILWKQISKNIAGTFDTF